MKNFAIGFMLGVWAGPVLKEVTRQQAVKYAHTLHEKAEANGT